MANRAAENQRQVVANKTLGFISSLTKTCSAESAIVHGKRTAKKKKGKNWQGYFFSIVRLLNEKCTTGVFRLSL